MAAGKKIAGAVLVLGVAAVGGAVAAAWVFRNVDAHLLIERQPVAVTIPGEVPVTARITSNLEIDLKTNLKTQVPVDQTIVVPVKDVLHVHVAFDHDVPIRMNVPVKAMIPVNQKIPVDTTVTVTALGVPVTLPLRGEVPIKAEIPVNLNIPVNQQVHLQFTAPAQVTLDEPLKLPLKTRIDTVVPISAHLSVPVESDLVAKVRIPEPLDAVIDHAELKVPLRTLRLTRNDAEGTATPAPAHASPKAVPTASQVPAAVTPKGPEPAGAR
ncbi:MAG: hypothetical protein EPN72_11395 [Nevskiaceae bacterium]|nr:MAG: hypothetical protein EPN63_01585 [Nevskiaceae bacterium]TBR71802.1 MAG: hypothetical protein EPN72_11395 [Nevskiaceae bacterium]